jgi:hypothetical protein
MTATPHCRPQRRPQPASVVASGLPLPSAVVVAADGTVYSTILWLVPGQAQVIPLT